VRWTVLTRDRAEQMLELVNVLRSRGLRVGGFVQVPSGPASSKPLGYDLYRLSHPERAPLAERIVHDRRRATGERYCELTFHAQTLARACEWLREDVAVSDLLIVDGIGRLEERGQGLFPALAWVRMQPRPKMIVLSSRLDHVPKIAQRLALSGRLVTELSFGSETVAPAHVVDHILHACGRIRRRRGQAHLE
jgi:nucleoside-triphosphatase THEP1